MDIDDKELFRTSVEDAPVTVDEPAPTPAPEPVVDNGPARDESGRFASKEEKAVDPAPVEPVKAQQEDGNVPSWRLREEREAREAAERRFQDAETRAQAVERHLAELRKQNEPKPEPVDFFTDPNAAFKQQLSPFEQQLQTMQSNLTLRASKAEAIADHGRAAVTEMEKAIETAMRERHPDMAALSVQMRQSDDPVGVAMGWYQRDKLLKETGGDLASYKTRTLDDALKDPVFLAKALEAAKAHATGQAPGAKPSTVVQLPPSISRATSAASPHEEAGDMSDRSLFAHATR